MSKRVKRIKEQRQNQKKMIAQKRRMHKQHKIEDKKPVGERTAQEKPIVTVEVSQEKEIKQVENKERKEIKPAVKSFMEKLRLWTANFTQEPLDLMVVLSNNRNLPKCSNIREYEIYEKIRREYDYYLIVSKNDPVKAWEAMAKGSDRMKEIEETHDDEER